MSSWNLADALDRIAAERGQAEALVQGARRTSWTDFERRARNLGAWMLSRGATHQGKVALYTYNHPAYLEGTYAAFKASLVPVNVNYRYREEELAYLLANADAEIAIVHEDFADLIGKVQPGLPKLKGVLVVSESGPAATGLAGAEDYETAAETERPAPEAPRSPDDMMFLYTGGTTGLPKGVMWRQDDLYDRFGGGGLGESPPDLDALAAFVNDPANLLRALIGPPLMHGTGWFTAMIALFTGGAVLLLDDARRFDADQLWAQVTRDRPSGLTIVGDSFGRPMVEALRARGEHYDLSSLRMVTSSGVMWSQENKQALLEYGPQMALVDAFGSSEALGMGTSITTAQGVQQTARFQLGEKTVLFDENLELVEAQPGARGMIGVGGRQPVGYYKDPEKSARTFVETPRGRFSVPGDWVEVHEDGVSLTLLGRGSVCINTGGEKVFPEEVEEVLKRHEGVQDAVVVGVPDEKWGEAITAVVSRAGGDRTEGPALIEFVKEQLAGYKAPKQVVFLDTVYRSPSGKADYKRTRKQALEALGLE
ncbi:MAG: AMP-binding protein [Planctomycetota bacterium]|nr:AMP-binding protein [Planctomycetota bacterium]